MPRVIDAIDLDGRAAATAREFDIAHGENAERDGEWLIFADGAARELNTMGARQQPHSDPVQRAKHVVVYWTTRYERLRDAYNEYFSRLSAIAHNASQPSLVYHAPPTDEHIEKLRVMREEVVAANASLAAAQQALQDVAKPPEVTAMERRHAHRARVAAAQIEELRL